MCEVILGIVKFRNRTKKLSARFFKIISMIFHNHRNDFSLAFRARQKQRKATPKSSLLNP